MDHPTTDEKTARRERTHTFLRDLGRAEGKSEAFLAEAEASLRNALSLGDWLAGLRGEK